MENSIRNHAIVYQQNLQRHQHQHQHGYQHQQEAHHPHHMSSSSSYGPQHLQAPSQQQQEQQYGTPLSENADNRGMPPIPSTTTTGMNSPTGGGDGGGGRSRGGNFSNHNPQHQNYHVMGDNSRNHHPQHHQFPHNHHHLHYHQSGGEGGGGGTGVNSVVSGSSSYNSGAGESGGGLSASYSAHKQHSRQLYAYQVMQEQQQQEQYYYNNQQQQQPYQQQQQQHDRDRSRASNSGYGGRNNIPPHQQQHLQHPQQFRNNQSSYNYHPSQRQRRSNQGHTMHYENMSVGSQYSVQSYNSHESSTVDERYLQWGQRLSRRAHGDDNDGFRDGGISGQSGGNGGTTRTHRKRVSYLKSSENSGFVPFAETKNHKDPSIIQQHDENLPGKKLQQQKQNLDQSPSSSSGNSVNRISKVAKKRLSDHGDHHAGTSQNTNGVGTGVSTEVVDKCSHSTSSSLPHLRRSSANLVNIMTQGIDDLFRRLYAEQKKFENDNGSNNERKNGIKTHPSTGTAHIRRQLSPTDNVSSQQEALAKLALDNNGQLAGPPEGKARTHESSQNRSRDVLSPEGRQDQHQHNHHLHHHHHHHGDHHNEELSSTSDLFTSSLNFPSKKQPNGLLSAVMEQSSITSSNPRSGGRDSKDDGKNGEAEDGSVRSRGSRGSSSIATRSSMGTRTSTRSFGNFPPRGKCLTQPSEGVSNEGLDNAEGNLIAYENDTISVGRKQIHVLTREKMKDVKHADFRVQSLLGQGTFAQVFECLHVQTGNRVAVKVVKNMPAYTRQAAVEIDVIRALTKQDDTIDESMKSSAKKQNSTSSENRESGDKKTAASNNDRWNHMVEMVCYFIYKGHLCLVFEILGMNLYEVLKKRQFRGLPLNTVRTLVRQAVLGTRELAHKSIVHCDIKPENILLASDDDCDSVITAGESKRLSSSMKSSSSMQRKNKTRGEPPSTTEVKTSPEVAGKKDNNVGCTTSNSSTTSEATNATSKKQLDETLQPKADENAAPATGVSGSDEVTAEEVEASRSTSHSPAHSDGTGATGTGTHSLIEQRIKLIDFGSACFEGQSSHTYIQSRFYRSPEVLVGLAFDSAIDMFSLGCVTAELFLGLPILPGVHEHDQLGRIQEMIGPMPDWMLDKGVKSSKYFVKFVPSPTPPTSEMTANSPPPRLPQWRLKTQQEFITSLSQNEIKRKGGLAKLEKQPKTRYFRRKRLADIVMHKGQSGSTEDKELLQKFIHFLYGILDPDPWKRLTALQAMSHPFLTDAAMETRENAFHGTDLKDESLANRVCNVYWKPPSDPNIYRRQLLNAQKMREKQQAARRSRHEQARTPSPGVSNSSARGIEHALHLSTSMLQNQQRRGDRNHPVQHNGYQIPSSMTDNGNQEYVRLSDDSSSVMTPGGPRIYYSGPQSYNEAASTIIPGSFNDLDFAYALQRPGVVPMSSSYASSVDMSVGQSSLGQAPNFIRQPSSESTEPFQNNVFKVSRSYEDVDVRNASVSGIYEGNKYMYSSSHNRGAVEGDDSQSGRPSTIINDSRSIDGSGRNSSSQTSMTAMPPPTYQSAQDQTQLHEVSLHDPLPPNNFTGVISVPNMDIKNPGVAHHPGLTPMGPLVGQDAQAFFQQQQAALQQQQLILQQQQAALAVQQEQLRAYGMNYATLGSNFNVPRMSGSHLHSPNSAGNQNIGVMTGQQQHTQYGVGAGSVDGVNPSNTASSASVSTATIIPGGYCYVTAADGTPVLVQLNPHSQFQSQIQGQMATSHGTIPTIGGGIANNHTQQLNWPGMLQGIPPQGIQGVAMAGSIPYPQSNLNGPDDRTKHVNTTN